MTVAWLLVAVVCGVLCAVAGFVLGRGAGARTGEAARAGDRLEAERLLGGERAAAAQRAEQLRQAERERDGSAAALGETRGELQAVRARVGELESARARLETELGGERAAGLERLEAARKAQEDRLAAARRAEDDRKEAARIAESDRREAARIAEEDRLETARQVVQDGLEAARRFEQERQETAQRIEQERREFVAEAQRSMAAQFERLAAGILEDKSKRFTDHNRTSLEQLLNPLREKLGEFQQKVEGLQQDGLVGRTELKTQIEALRGMNEKLSTDANNLVKALRNSSKQQGDWGEVLLVGMLEDAGLRAGHEYRLQASFATEEGRQARPDIILNLPDDKHLVIDSKVSLTSYAEYCAGEEEGARKAHLERHARSLASHIDGLSKKSYQTLHQLRSLDFVVMFVPIEPAYLLALSHDGSLWQRAWKKDVLLVSPGTLFPVIRTIAHIWQQERQTKNVEEIVRQGGALYDKVAAFAGSFEDVGKKLTGAQTAFDKAYGQLASGKGHVLSRIENLRRLGVRATKEMPRSLSGLDEPEAGDRAEAENLPLRLEDAVRPE